MEGALIEMRPNPTTTVKRVNKSGMRLCICYMYLRKTACQIAIVEMNGMIASVRKSNLRTPEADEVRAD